MGDDSRVTSIAARLRAGAGDPSPRTTPPAPASPAVVVRGWRRELASTVLELFGITVLVVGCYLILPCVGLIVAGLALILLGVATGLP